MAHAATYVQIGDHAGRCRVASSNASEIKYSALPGTFFEVVSDGDDWVEVKLFDESRVWIHATEVIRYAGGSPPPIALLGMAIPLTSDPELVDAAPTRSVPALSELGVLSAASLQLIETPKSTPEPTFDGTGPRRLSVAETPDIPAFRSSKILHFLESDLARSESLGEMALPPTSATTAISPTVNTTWLRPRPIYTYTPVAGDSFLYPPRPLTLYPQLDVDGFYEMKISGRDYRPKLSELTSTDNRWSIVQRDPVYLKLPSDVLLGSPKFDMRFRFNIEGKLADDLSVHYDVEQEPDFPGKYDVAVKYQRQELKFFHLDSEFKNGEFVNYRKSLNGVRYTNYDDNWSAILSAGKQRSEPKKFSANGTGRKEYGVGVRSLLNDSVKVWVNNAIQSEGRDYTVNYFDGVVTFTTVKGPADIIEIVYEFTNPIEDFIPVLSRKNFLGAQYLWKATKQDEVEPIELKKTEFIEIGVSSNAEWAGTTNITLSSASLVLGSEEIILNGVPLRRNVDYVARSRKGKIILSRRALDFGDRVTVNYSHYDTFETMDELIAQGTRGPYYLPNKTVLEDSETITVDGVSMKKTVDYELDNEGVLQFAYPIKYPSIISVKYRAAKVQKVSNTTIASGSPFNFGVTYLEESAKGQEDELVLSVSSENVSFSGNSFAVANNPIANQNRLVVMVNGVAFTAGSLAGPNTYTYDAYKGVFKLSNTYGSATAVVSYQYRKNYQTTYVFQGQTGVSKYRHTTEITFRDVPLKYNGVTAVRVFNGFIDAQLIPSVDYVVNYGTNGDDGEVSITFYKRGVVNPHSAVQSTRADYPLSGQRVTVVYSHAPEAAPDAGNISQRQVAFTLGTKLSDHWRVDTELSAAENNLSRPQLETEYTGVGQGGVATYFLGFKNVVENSETVFLNDQPQTRDQNYSINYVNGNLRFINLSPASTDRIRVRFKYVDPNGQTKGGASTGFKYASKLSTQYKSGPWTVQGDIKSIDKDYSPISPIQSQRGTFSFGTNVEYKRAENQLLGADYRRYEQLLSPVGDRTDLYRHTDEIGIRAKVFFLDAIDISQLMRYSLVYSDPAVDRVTGNLYSDDLSNFSWATGIGFSYGESRYIFNRNYSKAVAGILDNYDRNTSETDSYQMSTEWSFKRLMLLGNTSVRPNLEYSQTTVRALKTEANTESMSRSFSRKIGIGSRFEPLPRLDGSFDFSTEEQNTEADGVVGTPNRLTNYRLDSTYRPYEWLNMGGSLSNTERFSPLGGQKGQVSNEVRYQITTLAPYGMLTHVGFSTRDPVIDSLKGSFLTYSYGHADSRENNDLKRIDSNRQSVAYNSYTPVPGISLSRVSMALESNNSRDDAPTQTTSRNANSRSYQATAGKLDVRLQFPVLNLFSYGLGLETKQETQKYENIATNATSSVTVLDSPNDRRVQTLVFDPGPVMAGIPGLMMLNLGPFRTEIEESAFNSVSYQRIDQSVGGSVVTGSVAQDNADQRKLAATASLRPLNLFDLGGNGQLEKDKFSRNLSASNTGLTYREGKSVGATVGYSPFSFLSFNGDASYKQVDQYRSPSLNMTVDQLQSTEIRSSSTLFTDYIFQKKYSANLGVRLTPFSMISFKGSGTLSQVFDSLTATSSVSEQEFTEKVGTVGTEFRPLPGLSVGYDYSIRLTDTKGGSSSTGYTGRMSMNYSPIQTENIRVSVSYTRDDNWGRSLNALQQNETQNGTGDRIRYSVVDRNDTVELGSLSINILIPFKGNPYLENVTLTGEGQIKRVTDAFDAARALTGSQQIGYEISGMVFKATINF